MPKDDLPKGRVRRTARVGTVIGTQGARYAGTRAANLARSKERAGEALDARHLEAAERMVDVLGTMKGAAMKIGQLASFIDTEFIPEEEWDGEPVEELFEDFEQEATAAASIGQVHRAVLPDGRKVAVKVQYPGIAEALRADLQNAQMLIRMAKAL